MFIYEPSGLRRDRPGAPPCRPRTPADTQYANNCLIKTADISLETHYTNMAMVRADPNKLSFVIVLSRRASSLTQVRQAAKTDLQLGTQHQLIE